MLVATATTAMTPENCYARGGCDRHSPASSSLEIAAWRQQCVGFGSLYVRFAISVQPVSYIHNHDDVVLKQED